MTQTWHKHEMTSDYIEMACWKHELATNMRWFLIMMTCNEHGTNMSSDKSNIVEHCIVHEILHSNVARYKSCEHELSDQNKINWSWRSHTCQIVADLLIVSSSLESAGLTYMALSGNPASPGSSNLAIANECISFRPWVRKNTIWVTVYRSFHIRRCYPPHAKLTRYRKIKW